MQRLFSHERLFARELGSGDRTLVFLPGLGATTRYWEARVAPLGEEFRLVLVDLLGFGRSPKPRTRYSVERHVGALHATLGWKPRFTMIGHSLGAVLALAYAAKYPQQVERLILFSIPSFGSEEHAVRYFRSGTADQWLMSNYALAALTCILTRRVFGRLLPRLLPDFPREVAEDLVQHTWRSSTSSIWEAVYRHDLGRDADTLPTGLGVTCVHGDRDRTAPVDGVRALVQGRSGWSLTLLAGVDHHPLLRSAEACRSIIRSVASGLPDRGVRPAPMGLGV